jgi:hypothetical protein
MARLATVIEEARRRAFVGRRDELARFAAMLGGDDPRRVLFLHGPGGIGKTQLLGELGGRARAAGHVTVSIDAREVDWSPEGLRGAFDRAVRAGQAGGTGELAGASGELVAAVVGRVLGRDRRACWGSGAACDVTAPPLS